MNGPIPYLYSKMQINLDKTRLSVTFPFAAVVTLMLLLCDEEIVSISLFSSFFHEGGHLFFMYLFDEKPLCITFGAFGIRIERNCNSRLEPKKESWIALGGIFGNCLLFVCGFTFYLLYNGMWAARLAAVNFFIAAFNMLPVRSLDFGRCLECLLSDSQKGDRVLSVLSVITAVFVAAGCLIYNAFVSLNVSLIAVSVYIILITTLKE